MTDFAAEDVLAAAPRLTPASYRHILRCVLASPEAKNLSPGGALILWLADHLATDDPAMPTDQQALVIDEFKGHLLDFGAQLWKVLEPFEAVGKRNDVPAANLTLWDHHYVSMTNHGGYLDLHTGVWLAVLSTAPLVISAVDLTTLFIRSRATMLKMRTQRECKEARNEGSPWER
jgi:hypothetical protein